MFLEWILLACLSQLVLRVVVLVEVQLAVAAPVVAVVGLVAPLLVGLLLVD